MSTYTVEDPTTGKSLDLEGDSPPTEEELNQVFSTVHGTSAQTQTPPQPPTMGQKAASIFKSPQDLLASVPPLLNKGADYLGQKTAESLAGGTLFKPDSIMGKTAKAMAPMFPGKPITMPPQVAAAIGTGVAMAPDIAMSFANPEEGAAGKVDNSYAQDKALSSIGTPRRLIKSEPQLDMARNHAQTLLDQGIVKPFQGAEGMAEDLSKLEEKSGSRIGEILDTLGEKGKVFDPQEAIQEINQLRPVSKSTGAPLKGGAYDQINNKIDNAVATIQAHMPQTENGVMNQPLSFSVFSPCSFFLFKCKRKIISRRLIVSIFYFKD